MDFTLTGRIDDQGNILISNKQAWLEYLRLNKGRNIVGNFEVFTGMSNTRQLKYFRTVHLKQMQTAFIKLGSRYTTQEIENILIGDYHKYIVLKEANTIELTAFLDFVRQYASENLDINID